MYETGALVPSRVTRQQRKKAVIVTIIFGFPA